MAVHHMTPEQEQMARRLRSKGLKLKEVARGLSCSMSLMKASVYAQNEEVGRPDRWMPAPGHLSTDEREEILLGLARGGSMSEIARSVYEASRWLRMRTALRSSWNDASVEGYSKAYS